MNCLQPVLCFKCLPSCVLIYHPLVHPSSSFTYYQLYIPPPCFKQLPLYTLTDMRFSHLSSLALLSSVLAQRPSDVSICDYYTTALLTDDTAANQETLLILVVNTAVIGNYTTPNVGIALPGILALGQTYNGVEVNLLQYFDGELVSTNNNGVPSVVNFLDGGGAAALKQNLPAFTTSSNQ